LNMLSPRIALFRGQDCIVPAHAAALLNDSGRSLSIEPGELTWEPDVLASFPSSPLPSSRFAFDGQTFEAVALPEIPSALQNAASASPSPLPPAAESIPARQLALSFSSRLGRFVLIAKAHAGWARVSRFCGACGSALVDANGRADISEPLDEHAHGARFCPACGQLFFPRMSPAVIVLVHRGGKILLAHNVRFPGARHSLLAGFVEIGETLEEAIVREVREEAGIEVRSIRYVRSQSWPFPDSLMLGFTAEWASGEARPDGKEIDHLDWYGPGEYPELPMQGSIARWLIDRFSAGELPLS